MKKVLVMIVAMALVGSTANAATLWMQFEGGGNEVTLVPSQNVNVEIWVDLVAGDTLSGVGGPFWPTSTADQGAYPNYVEGLEAVAWGPGTDAMDWITPGGLGVVGSPTHSISLAAPTAAQVIDGPGSFLLGVMTIHQNNIINADSTYFNEDGTDEFDFYPIMFGGNPAAIPNLSNGTGADYPFSPVYQAYSGYYTWGQGASAVSGKGPGGAYNLPDNPLIVHCIPEPASLALLALGGLAIIRRR